ncbi:MAG: LPD38 domain-containing protein, partial [Clostridia bacterium]
NAIPNAQETVERFRTMYPNYVPTLRSNADDTDMMRETFGDMGGALQSASVHFKHATGSDKAIKSPIESMAIRVQEIVSATDKVLAMRKFHEVMQAVPGLGEFAREVSAPSSVEIRSAKEAIFDAEREAHNAKRALSHATQRGDSEQISSAGIRVEGATQGLANARGALERMQSVNTDELTRILDASGKEHFYQITDKVLFDVLQGKPHEVEGVLRLVGRVTGVFKKLTTANNPFFAVSNMLRDYVEAYTKGSAWTPVDFTIDWAKALGELTREAVTGKATARLTQYRAAGGGDASISPNTNPGVAAMEQALYGDYIKDSLAKIARGRDFKERLRGPVDGLRGLGRSLTSAIGAANNVIEGSQRYAEFSRQVRKGANTTDAFRAGMDVTTDFRRSGNAYSVKAAGNVFAFMNAGLQGTYSMYRMVQEGKFDQKQLAGRIAKSLAMYAVLPVLIRTLIRGDDEDEQAYQLMAENVKRNNYLIPKSWVGGKKGEFFKWALPNGPLPATGDAFGRALVESIEHEGRLDAWVQYGLGDYAKETLGELVESINPFSSPIYAPISQLMQNRTWYDAPIVPEWMRSEHISKSQQVTDATSSVGIFFANLPGLKDNVSPIQVDYLINQSFGVLGDLALSDAGDALTAKLQGDGAWLGVFKAAGKTV